MTHVHEPLHFPINATGWQVCECGATRRVENGKVVGGWHACDLCVTSFWRALVLIPFLIFAACRCGVGPETEPMPPERPARDAGACIADSLRVGAGDRLCNGVRGPRLTQLDAGDAGDAEIDGGL